MSTISGMTGFGRAEAAHGAWTWSVEARSVNGRNLEVRFRGPPGFDSLEAAAKASARRPSITTWRPTVRMRKPGISASN
ncbi:MAG: hypothetical protein KKG14_02165, partial [Alphaproteobacteria bacterium]|nr:hypothetical protein [Alphaproteobacteria bacterium]